MWKLIQKNFKIALYSKSFLFLAFYVLYLAMMKIPTLGWAAAANVIVTFVLIESTSIENSFPVLSLRTCFI